jgi:hypothetical protein
MNRARVARPRWRHSEPRWPRQRGLTRERDSLRRVRVLAAAGASCPKTSECRVNDVSGGTPGTAREMRGLPFTRRAFKKSS